jgi:hypothetical protein
MRRGISLGSPSKSAARAVDPQALCRCWRSPQGKAHACQQDRFMTFDDTLIDDMSSDTLLPEDSLATGVAARIAALNERFSNQKPIPVLKQPILHVQG